MKLLSISIFVTLLLSNTFANEYVVVSNKRMKEISKTQLKAIFLKKLTIIDDKKIIPINLEPKDKLRVNFEKRVLKMNFGRLKSYWTKQHYLGHRPPLSMKSQESIIAFIKRVDGAIGYIERKNLDEDLKIIYKWEE